MLFRRLTVAAAVAALSVGNLAVCAGWRATAEARMACCQDESTCPLHESAKHGSAPHHQLTQAQADTCCAASERNDSATTRPAYHGLSAFAPSPATVSVVELPAVPSLREWRALLPSRASPVPRHLLLSVLLV